MIGPSIPTASIEQSIPTLLFPYFQSPAPVCIRLLKFISGMILPSIPLQGISHQSEEGSFTHISSARSWSESHSTSWSRNIFSSAKLSSRVLSSPSDSKSWYWRMDLISFGLAFFQGWVRYSSFDYSYPWVGFLGRPGLVGDSFSRVFDVTIIL